MVSITIFQNRKHIGGYRDVQNFFLQNLTKNMKKTLENKSVVQKMKYHNNCDGVCAGVWAPCLIDLTIMIIYLFYTYCYKLNLKKIKEL